MKILRLKKISGKCKGWDLKHMHVLCQCPLCVAEGHEWWQCILSNKYLQEGEIDVK